MVTSLGCEIGERGEGRRNIMNIRNKEKSTLKLHIYKYVHTYFLLLALFSAFFFFCIFFFSVLNLAIIVHGILCTYVKRIYSGGRTRLVIKFVLNGD